MSELKFCDLMCRYAQWPDKEALDGAGACRTFQAIFCKKKKCLVYKNSPCQYKENRSQVSNKGLENDM
jgi:hypothetical protein